MVKERTEKQGKEMINGEDTWGQKIEQERVDEKDNEM